MCQRLRPKEGKKPLKIVQGFYTRKQMAETVGALDRASVSLVEALANSEHA